MAEGGSTPGETEPAGPTEFELLGISHEVCPIWRNVGIRLGLPDHVLNDIDGTASLDTPQKKALKMLVTWRQEQATPSREALADALEQERRADLAQTLHGNQPRSVQYRHRQGQDATRVLEVQVQKKREMEMGMEMEIDGTCAGRQEASTSQAKPQPEVREVAAFLKERYKEMGETINPLPWNEEWLLYLDSVYTKLQIVSKGKIGNNQQTGEYCDVEEIFKPAKGSSTRKPRVVLVEGEPGIGKTTFSQKLTYDWAWDKFKTSESFPDFEILLSLKCRDFSHAEGHDFTEEVDSLLRNAIAKLFPRDRPALKDALFRYVKQADSRTLLLLDGLNELPKDIDLLPLIQGNFFSRLSILLTSRENPALRRYCNSLFQITGFTLDDAKSYICKFFGSGEGNSADFLKRLEDEYREDGRALQELIRSPLNTMYLCLVCRENGQLPSQRTQVYQRIVECILRVHYKKKEQEPPADPAATHERELAALGRLALKGLQNDRLSFSDADFELEDPAKGIVEFGFLSRGSSTSILKPRTCYEFPHKTMQEFFAALCLREQLLSGDFTCLNYLGQATDSTDSTPKYEQVAVFVAGLLCQDDVGRRVCVDFLSSFTRSLSTVELSGFLFICAILRECGDCPQQQDREEAVVSEFGWERLRLREQQLSENSTEYRIVCRALKKNCPLKTLNLNHSNIKDWGPLADSLEVNTSLQHLSLIGNAFTVGSASALARVLSAHPTLERLTCPEEFRGELEGRVHRNPRLVIRYWPIQPLSDLL